MGQPKAPSYLTDINVLWLSEDTHENGREAVRASGIALPEMNQIRAVVFRGSDEKVIHILRKPVDIKAFFAYQSIESVVVPFTKGPSMQELIEIEENPRFPLHIVIYCRSTNRFLFAWGSQIELFHTIRKLDEGDDSYAVTRYMYENIKPSDPRDSSKPIWRGSFDTGPVDFFLFTIPTEFEIPYEGAIWVSAGDIGTKVRNMSAEARAVFANSPTLNEIVKKSMTV